MAVLAGARLHAASPSDLQPFLTPYKLNRLILDKSAVAGGFDSKGVDAVFVYSHEGKFYMTYLGFDGIGYQTGLAESSDLVNWKKLGVILARDPKSRHFQYNIAMTSILREDSLSSAAPLKKVNGQYLGTWHAYPKPGYEGGAAVIGLAWSKDLRHWKLSDPVLRPQDGAAWERGGLYKSYLVKDADTYYLFYNAKNRTESPWAEQIGVASSRDLKVWKRYAGNPIIHNGSAGSPDEIFASDPFVVRHQGLWAIFYFGVSADFAAGRDLLAIGPDPFHPSKTNQVIIDVGGPGSIDEKFAHKPAMLSWQGDLYHFYTAVSGGSNGKRGISVARSRPW